MIIRCEKRQIKYIDKDGLLQTSITVFVQLVQHSSFLDSLSMYSDVPKTFLHFVLLTFFVDVFSQFEQSKKRGMSAAEKASALQALYLEEVCSLSLCLCL